MVIMEPCAGLSNRILALATAYELALHNGHRMILLWDIDATLGANFTDLFEKLPNVKIIRTSKAPFRQKPILRLKGEVLRKFYSGKADIYLGCDEIHMHKEYEWIKEAFVERKNIYVKSFEELYPVENKNIFKVFKPSAMVKSRGKKVFSQIKENTVGIHIRRTDHEDAISHSGLEQFEQIINDLLETGQAENIFLATDDQVIERRLMSLFPGRIFCYEGKKFTRKNRDGMVDAVIDLLALGGCKKIIGSYGSTFSKMASYLGQTKLEIVGA